MALESILLGLLDEPRSGYDLKAEFREGARHFWNAELSQIYRTLQRMEQGKLVSSRFEPSERGPARRVYRRTRLGKAALVEWLEAEPALPESRLAYVAQIHFTKGPQKLRRLLKRLRPRLAARVDALRAVDRSFVQESERDLSVRLTLDLGLAVARARLRWCDLALRRVGKRMVTA